MYDLTTLDKQQVILRPTVDGPKAVNDNTVRIKYHENKPGEDDILFNDTTMSKILPYIKDKSLADSYVSFHNRYNTLTREIRKEQFPKPHPMKRFVLTAGGSALDLKQHNEDVKATLHPKEQQELVTNMEQVIKQTNDANKKQQLFDIQQQYEIINSDQSTPEQKKIALETLEKLPIDHATELSLLQLPTRGKPAEELVGRVYKMVTHPIDYLELYNALFRGKQRMMSKKLLHEIAVNTYARLHLTQDELAQASTHRAAVLVWKLMNSDDIDHDAVTQTMLYIDSLPDHKIRPLIHSNPEIMGDSWIVEAFNNRNNPNYSSEIIRGAKAADADLNRFKLFLNDTELVPKRLNVFLGLHYLKTKRTIPALGFEPFFRALNYCRYPGQVATLLNIAITQTPGLIVPPRGIFEAIIAAHRIGAHDTIEHLSNYLRHTTGVDANTVLPMDYRVGSIYIDSLQQRQQHLEKRLDLDINSETTAVLIDMIRRKELPDIFTRDPLEAFVFPEKTAINALPLIGGNTDPNVHPHLRIVSQHWEQIRENAKQQNGGQDVEEPELMTYNINAQAHFLPNVSYTAINYALRSLCQLAKSSNLLFRKPVRIYVGNMQTVKEEFESKVLATDRNDNAASIDEIQQGINGEPIYKNGNKFGIDEMALIPFDQRKELTLPKMADDINDELRNLTAVLDAADMQLTMTDERNTPISPHLAHLVEQCIPTIAYNPHIYEDVADIIHIKTGIGRDQLRNPNRVDQYLSEHVEEFMRQYKVNITKNVRFGYFEISTEDMNQLATKDFDQLYNDYHALRERELRYHEEHVKIQEQLGHFESLENSQFMDHPIAASAFSSKQQYIRPSHVYNQKLLDAKFGTHDGVPLSDDELTKQAILGTLPIERATKMFRNLEYPEY